MKKLRKVLLVVMLIFVLSSCSNDELVPEVSIKKVAVEKDEVNFDFVVTNFDNVDNAMLFIEKVEDDEEETTLVAEQAFEGIELEGVVTFTLDNLEAGNYLVRILVTYGKDDETVLRKEYFTIIEDEIVDVELREVLPSEELLIHDAYYKGYKWYGEFIKKIANITYEKDENDIVFINGIRINENEVKSKVTSKTFNYLSLLTYLIETDTDLVKWLENIEENLGKMYYFEKRDTIKGDGTVYDVVIPDMSRNYSGLLSEENVDSSKTYENYTYKEVFAKLGFVTNYNEFAAPLEDLEPKEISGGNFTFEKNHVSFDSSTGNKYIAEIGEDVYAPISGEVTKIDKVGSVYRMNIKSEEYGNLLIANLEYTQVKEGDFVQKGQVIAEVGDLENALGSDSNYISIIYSKDDITLNFDFYMDFK